MEVNFKTIHEFLKSIKEAREDYKKARYDELSEVVKEYRSKEFEETIDEIIEKVERQENDERLYVRINNDFDLCEIIKKVQKKLGKTEHTIHLRKTTDQTDVEDSEHYTDYRIILDK